MKNTLLIKKIKTQVICGLENKKYPSHLKTKIQSLNIREPDNKNNKDIFTTQTLTNLLTQVHVNLNIRELDLAQVHANLKNFYKSQKIKNILLANLKNTKSQYMRR